MRANRHLLRSRECLSCVLLQFRFLLYRYLVCPRLGQAFMVLYENALSPNSRRPPHLLPSSHPNTHRVSHRQAAVDSRYIPEQEQSFLHARHNTYRRSLNG